MNRIARRIAWPLALVIALVALQSAPAAAQREDAWIDVLSVRLEANGLIVIVCRDIGEVQFADGTHQTESKIEVVFRGGRLVSVTEREAFIADSFFLADDGKVMMKVEEGEKPFPDDDFRLQETRGDRGRERRATGFRVRDGNIVSGLIDWLG